MSLQKEMLTRDAHGQTKAPWPQVRTTTKKESTIPPVSIRPKTYLNSNILRNEELRHGSEGKEREWKAGRNFYHYKAQEPALKKNWFTFLHGKLNLIQERC